MADSKTKRRLNRVLRRSFYYFKQGYGLATLPFAFLSWSTTIYYLAIENVPALESLFPRFGSFLMLGALFMIPACGFLGYLFIKKSWFYRETFEITREVSPYALRKVQPVAVPFYEASVALFKLHGIDTSAIQKIVDASK